METRLPLAVTTGKIASLLSRNLRIGGGTTFPGQITRRLDHQALAKMALRLKAGSTVVTGTNGKTTTSRMISNVMKAANLKPVHNRAGANLIDGVTAAVLDSANLLGYPQADVGLFEVDEAMFPTVVREVQPRAMVITNLFRDQLDRYGEIDYLARIWREALAQLDQTATTALNADDPSVAHLGYRSERPVLYFGLDDESFGQPGLQHTADSRYCINCGGILEYRLSYYGHIGKYRCTKCDFSRPTPHVSARKVVLDGVKGSQCTLDTPRGQMELHIGVPGLYNVYNTLAVVACGLALDLPTEAILTGIHGFTAAFGRLETVQVDDKKLFLALVKNPVGFNEVLRTLFTETATRPMMIVINDNIADGTDISWLWDVDFELLSEKTDTIVLAGTRAEDMATRLKYAGVSVDRLTIEKDLPSALTLGLSQVQSNDTLYVLPTYTAMLEIRDLLRKTGHVGRFWQD